MDKRITCAASWRAFQSVFVALLAIGAALIDAPAAVAQGASGTVQGRVTSADDGAPLPGVRVYVEGTTRGGLTGERGAFRLDDVPAGERVVVFQVLGHRTERRPVTLSAGDALAVDVQMSAEALPIAGVVVSATREAQSLAQTAATVGVVQSSEIRQARPTHPSEIMGKIPGVWVNVTAGEGHATAIRQPLTTDPVYLFLEDGVPTRSTGFFNHNALYEINLPQAERIEVIKGPSSALYGSDAIGGTINVETRPAVAAPGLEATTEVGANGYLRLLGSYAHTTDADGLRGDLNLTRTDGWRDGTAYDRQGATLRWDRALSGGQSLKTVAAFSRIDQQTAGSSRLPEQAFLDNPTLNLTPVSFREVAAARLSTEYERAGASSLLSVTPFARYNAMDILPNWSLSYDPAIWETSNRSLGVLAKFRRDFDPLQSRVIVGLDVDWSPGEHFERRIDPFRDGGVFTDYTTGDVLYDYDVTFLGVSPYLHAETSPTERLRVTAGLRFDRIGYDYENRLTAEQSGSHRRPASTSVRYSEASPKLGATFDLGSGASVFVSYSQGFRAPSESQLFRQGVAVNTVGLEPVEATNYEAGLRGSIAGRFTYDLAAYSMTKTNDILDFQRADDVRETQNAGGTLHRGIELGLGVALPADLTLRTAMSIMRHTYETWRPNAGTDFSGNEIENGPRTMANTSLAWAPDGPAGPRVELESVYQGGYWLNAENTERYDGHHLVNLSANWPVHPTVAVFGKLKNVMDETYAESAGYSAFRGREFAPGLPRTLYVGAQVTFTGGL
ncbi:MAG: TonB-dependent receptor [Gemmatimonadota bacterium]